MTDRTFFEKQTLSSRVKASIVSEYFPQYCKIIVKRHMPRCIGYFDLFAGPGVYEDGNCSTPLLVAKIVLMIVYLRIKYGWFLMIKNILHSCKKTF